MKGTPQEWRDIPGYGGAYQMSWSGEVRSFRCRGRIQEKSHILKPYKHLNHGNGLFVKLTGQDGKSHDVKLVKLAALVWFGGVPAGKVPYHKNGELDDNSAGNIGFTARKELGKKTAHKSGKRIPVAKIVQSGEVLEFYPSARSAAKANFVSYQSVMDRCNGKVKNEYALCGYSFRWDK